MKVTGRGKVEFWKMLPWQTQLRERVGLFLPPPCPLETRRRQKQVRECVLTCVGASHPRLRCGWREHPGRSEACFKRSTLTVCPAGT